MFPLVFICNNKFPNKRRDSYVSPDNIPIDFINVYSDELILYCDNDEIVIHDGYYPACDEKTPKNGVLTAIEDLMEDGNPERYAQVLTSCRRLWSDTTKTLFDEVLPNYSAKVFKTRSGKEIDITGDHDNNKLSAVIETLQSKASNNTLVGSETIYLIDWMEQINRRQSAGVHSDVTREQAMQCIIHTYIALGDILSLKAEVAKQSTVTN